MNSYLKITKPVHRSFSEGGNGRVYDPKLARFLNPDPVIANPTFTQDYNAYSYVRNNPLGYVDPSGYILISAAVRAWAEGLLRDGGENGSYYTSSGGGGLYNFTSQDNAFVAASNILDMSNGWSYTEAGTREGSEYNFNSAMGYYKSVNRKRITGFNINFRFTSKSHERTSLNTFRVLDPSFSLFSYKDVVKEVWVGPIILDGKIVGNVSSEVYNSIILSSENELESNTTYLNYEETIDHLTGGLREYSKKCVISFLQG
jgi:hypothetical protein